MAIHHYLHIAARVVSGGRPLMNYIYLVIHLTLSAGGDDGGGGPLFVRCTQNTIKTNRATDSGCVWG